MHWLPENGSVLDPKMKAQPFPSLSWAACVRIPHREMVSCSSVQLMEGIGGAQMMRSCFVTLLDDGRRDGGAIVSNSVDSE
jgi:hypothetical protein